MTAVKGNEEQKYWSSGVLITYLLLSYLAAAEAGRKSRFDMFSLTTEWLTRLEKGR